MAGMLLLELNKRMIYRTSKTIYQSFWKNTFGSEVTFKFVPVAHRMPQNDV